MRIYSHTVPVRRITALSINIVVQVNDRSFAVWKKIKEVSVK